MADQAVEHGFDKEYKLDNGLRAVQCKCGARSISSTWSHARSKFQIHINDEGVNPMGDEDQTEVEKTETTTERTETQTHPEGNDDPAAPHRVEPEQTTTTETHSETVESSPSSDNED